jgi:hypothetical protein
MVQRYNGTVTILKENFVLITNDSKITILNEYGTTIKICDLEKNKLYFIYRNEHYVEKWFVR